MLPTVLEKPGPTRLRNMITGFSLVYSGLPDLNVLLTHTFSHICVCAFVKASEGLGIKTEPQIRWNRENSLSLSSISSCGIWLGVAGVS